MSEDPKVEVAGSPECVQGIVDTMQGKREADFTVKRAQFKFAGVAERNERAVYVVSIAWETVSAGFGELTIFFDPEGQLSFDSERMSPAFVKAVLAKLVDQAVESGGFE